MTKTISGSLLVCAGAALFATGALLFNDASTGTSIVTAPPAVGAPARVDISGFAFSAARVAPGASVTVTNRDDESHTLTSKHGLFDTQAIDGRKTVTFTAPRAPGTYQFFCAIHPSMRGELVVAG
jgi:plastocyanin